MRHYLTKLAGIFLLLLLVAGSGKAADIVQGELLFKKNCSACHTPTRKIIGPALVGIEAKYNDNEYLYSFIRNSQAVINGGDERAVSIYKEFKKQIMTPMEHLTDDNIADILAYVESAGSTSKEKKEGEMAIRPLPPKKVKSWQPLYLKGNLGLWLLYSAAVLLLIGALLYLVKAMDLLEETA